MKKFERTGVSHSIIPYNNLPFKPLYFSMFLLQVKNKLPQGVSDQDDQGTKEFSPKATESSSSSSYSEVLLSAAFFLHFSEEK